MANTVTANETYKSIALKHSITVTQHIDITYE